LREESEQQRGHVFQERGHDSQEKFSVNFWPKYFSVVGGRTVRIRTVHTIPYSRTMDLAQKSRHFGHRISRQISVFCSLFLGRTEQSVQLTVGTENEVEEAVQQYGFGTENEADFCGTDLVL
jgi:hypothetical protein